MLNFKRQTLLVLSPHPDDEVLGCGGLIKRIKDEGGKVYILFLTVGQTNDYSKKGNSTASQRLSEIERAAKFLKYDGYKIAFEGDKYHLKLDQIPQKDIMQEIENGKDISLNVLKPTIVATPHLSDYNQDHRATAEAVFAATRPAPEEVKPLQRIVLGYESVATADWWDMSPRNLNVLVTLKKNELETKLKALKLYGSQVRNGYHPRSLRSVKNLAHFRGLQAGTEAAEAFFSYRIIL